ncbi:MAG: type III pantothenate kinase [Candidatus Omnitrophica bacterium]|nr:type III pantothenate kinase [Candidatus Omnitrophota bacterium]
MLAIDVGNTSIHLGLFQGRRLTRQGRVLTHGPHIEEGMRRFLKKEPAVIVSSVVPKATAAIKKALRALDLPKPLVLGENIEAPVINRYRIPAQVGQDRLVNAAAAFFLYGGPAIVVDFGTAITIDLVSGRREYLGGLIVPGIEIALEALSCRAALLPRIRLTPPKEFLGKDTASSMKSGIFYGYSQLCDGIVRRLKAKHAPSARVIATGGYAPLIVPFCRVIRKVNPILTLQGLEITSRSQKSC